MFWRNRVRTPIWYAATLMTMIYARRWGCPSLALGIRDRWNRPETEDVIQFVRHG